MTEEITLLESEIKTLEDRLAIETNKSELIILRKEIRSKSSDLKKLIKVYKDELKIKLKSVKSFIELLETYCSFADVMKDSMEDFKDMTKFIIKSFNDSIIIYPKNINNMFMKTIIKLKDNDNLFFKWIIDNNKNILFDFGEFNMFKGLSFSPGKKGAKMVIEDTQINDDFIISGHFYNDAIEGTQWTYKFKCLDDLEKIDIDENFPEFKDIDILEEDHIKIKDNGCVILEMSDDMLRIKQKPLKVQDKENKETNLEMPVFQISYIEVENTEFSKVIIKSKSHDGICEIYQAMNVIAF